MGETEALARVRELCEESLGLNGRHPVRGAWLTMLAINRVLADVEPGMSLTRAEAQHLAAVVPLVGSGAVDMAELDWFEANEESLVAKLEGAASG